MTLSGQALKEQGMQQAADHADRVGPGWTVRALEYVRSFPQEEFMAEDVRSWAYQMGLERPPHERSWGAVMAAARKEEIIAPAGYRQVSNPKAHQTPAAFWVRLVPPVALPQRVLKGPAEQMDLFG